jgi:putative hydrolase of the HAD superfamily
MSDYKNIVFDMGKVLLDYEADRVTRHFTDDPAIIREVNLLVFHSCEWTLLDGDLISEDDAAAVFRKRASSPQVADIAEKSFRNWEKYNLYPHPGMDEIIRDLKAAGHRIYLLSNIALRFANNPQMIRMIPAYDCFDGMFFSAPHKCIKPQPMIYRMFCEEYHLKPEDCLFIDDLKGNIDAAIASGMNGYVFDGDREKLRSFLKI